MEEALRPRRERGSKKTNLDVPRVEESQLPQGLHHYYVTAEVTGEEPWYGVAATL